MLVLQHSAAALAQMAPKRKSRHRPAAASSMAGEILAATEAGKRNHSAFLVAALKSGQESQGSTSQPGPPSRRASIQKALEKAMAPEGVEDPAVVSSPDGSSMLNSFASAMVRKPSSVATSRAARNVEFLPNLVMVGSACSGTDVWHFCSQ